MIIKEVKLSDEEKKFIYNRLIELFSLDPQYIAESLKGVEINFPLNELIEVYATLDLNVEYDEFDGNHQCNPISVYANLKKINMYHKGNPVKGLEQWNIEDLIKDYDWLKYF
jgi:hypothetical protein